MKPLLEITERGLHCSTGGFFVDPWGPVDCAVITHAHSDHAHWGSRIYLTAEAGREILRRRLGPNVVIETLGYGQVTTRNGVKVSLHPAGHVLGSAQVRVEYQGEVWVVSGDYKTEDDGMIAPYEPIRCNTFITESTFGLPIYRWRPQAEIYADINGWWRSNQADGRSSVVFGYSLGKAQRILAGLDGSIGPIYVHGAIAAFLPAYEAAGVRFPNVELALGPKIRAEKGQAMILAPPSADNTPWLRKFGDVSTAFASGWMQVRGTRRRRALDRGFVLSDHADWEGLIASIRATGAERVFVTHGYADVLARWLRENGWQAEAVRTKFTSEVEEDAEMLPPIESA
ncbi:MAG: ligase-associated DNA damage response exonuclease [Limisphaerales bacterium]